MYFFRSGRLNIENLSKNFLKLLILFLIFMLQTSVLPSFIGFNIYVNPVFAFCILLSLIGGGAFPVVLSAVCGFLIDALTGNIKNVFFYTYISYFAVLFGEKLSNPSFLSAIISLFVATLLFEIFSLGAELFTGGNASFLAIFMRRILPKAVFTGALSIVIYPLIKLVVVKR